MADRPPAAADRRGRVRRDHRAVGTRDAEPHGAGGDARADRGVARRRGRRLPPAAPGHGRLVRTVVLAADRDATVDAARRWTSGSTRCRPCSASTRDGQDTGRMDTFSGDASTWEAAQRRGAGRPRLSPAPSRSTRCSREHPWLAVCEQVSRAAGLLPLGARLRPVFARGGFDLQVETRPGCGRDSDVDALLAEGDPWWQLARQAVRGASRAARARDARAARHRADLVLDGTADIVACSRRSSAPSPNYPAPDGLQPDLYRCFMEQTWRHSVARGIVGLIHPETHFTDEKAGPLRAATYRRLRRHWQFINELKLFEIHHQCRYGVHVYGAPERRPASCMATSLYHPDTVERSFDHDGVRAEPASRTRRQLGLRPHAGAHSAASTSSVLETWHAVLEVRGRASPPDPDGLRRQPAATARRSTSRSRSPRIGELGLEFSLAGTRRPIGRRATSSRQWGRRGSWDDVDPPGPAPLRRTRRSTSRRTRPCCTTRTGRHVDFETLAPDAIPVTSYKPAATEPDYDCAYTHWGDDEGALQRATTTASPGAHGCQHRRADADPALIPPGAAHMSTVSSSAGCPPTSARSARWWCRGFCRRWSATSLFGAVPKSDDSASARSSGCRSIQHGPPRWMQLVAADAAAELPDRRLRDSVERLLGPEFDQIDGRVVSIARIGRRLATSARSGRRHCRCERASTAARRWSRSTRSSR